MRSVIRKSVKDVSKLTKGFNEEPAMDTGPIALSTPVYLQSFTLKTFSQVID